MRSAYRWSCQVALGLVLALPGSLLARELVLLGLADMRGRSTFRTVRRETRKSDSSTRFDDLSAQGLRAGTTVIDEPEDSTVVYDRTEELRTVFRPTLYLREQTFRQYQVKEVSLQMGGGQGTLEQVTQQWGTGSTPEEIFDLPTTSVEESALTTMFQTLLERDGDGTSLPGFMIKSPVPAYTQGPFHVRFTVVVEDAVAWVIHGRVITVAQPGGLPTKRVLEFRSGRRGYADLSVNGALVTQDFPVAAGHRYLLDLGTSTGTGSNTALLQVTDPSDGTSQSLSLGF